MSLHNEAESSTGNKPESFQRLENLARQVFAVPKGEVDALEKEERRKQRKRVEINPKPAK